MNKVEVTYLDGEWVNWEDEETGIQDLDEYFDFINEVE